MEGRRGSRYPAAAAALCLCRCAARAGSEAFASRSLPRRQQSRNCARLGHAQHRNATGGGWAPAAGSYSIREETLPVVKVPLPRRARVPLEAPGQFAPRCRSAPPPGVIVPQGREQAAPSRTSARAPITYPQRERETLYPRLFVHPHALHSEVAPGPRPRHKESELMAAST